MAAYSWPTADDVAGFLRQPLSAFTPAERAQMDAFLDAAIDTARALPDWRHADLLPPRVWSAVVELAAKDYARANPTAVRGEDAVPTSDRWTILLRLGYGRGGKPRVR
jgi:hypothetical protein